MKSSIRRKKGDLRLPFGGRSPSQNSWDVHVQTTDDTNIEATAVTPSPRSARSISSPFSVPWKNRQTQEDSDSSDEDTPGAAVSPNAPRRKPPRVKSEKKPAKKKSASKQSPEEEAEDGNESDTGISYRQHCMSTKSLLGTKSCMRKPSFMLKNSAEKGAVQVTPSPSSTESEFDEPNGEHPPELPGDVVRYSFRTAIGDGTEKQVASASVMERRDLRPNNCHLDVSHWSDKGGRGYMEDRYVIEDMGNVQLSDNDVFFHSDLKSNDRGNSGPPSLEVTWFGVYDGHGGERASQYCADWMCSFVRNQMSFPFDIGYAMKTAYHSLDDSFVGTGLPDGTTAVSVAVLGRQKVICANAGDSRAIIIREDGSIARLSRDHKPGVPDETRRITELGGRVVYWGRWRVEGLLAVSRAIGDASLKPYVTADPEICEYDIRPNDRFVVLASDGIWDVLDNKTVARIVLTFTCFVQQGEMVTDGDNLKWIARKLCDHAKYVHGMWVNR
eukprot:scaffold6581_cov57-Attheya_sp.AAC.13